MELDNVLGDFLSLNELVTEKQLFARSAPSVRACLKSIAFVSCCLLFVSCPEKMDAIIDHQNFD